MKRILALTLLLLSIIAIAEPVLADPGGSSGGQWETVTVTLQSLVSSIGEFLDFTDIENGDTVVRGAFFLLLFIIFYTAGIRAFGQLTTEKSKGKETTWAAITAFLISLIVVILTPEGLIVTFLSQFGIFLWVALYFILYAGVLWFLYVFLPSFVTSNEDGTGINKFGARLLSGSRVLFSLLAMSMLQEFKGSFVRVSSTGIEGRPELLQSILNQMSGYILILFSIILIYELFRLFTAGAADERFKNNSGSSLFSSAADAGGNALSSAAKKTRDLSNSALDKVTSEEEQAENLEDTERSIEDIDEKLRKNQRREANVFKRLRAILDEIEKYVDNQVYDYNKVKDLLTRAADLFEEDADPSIIEALRIEDKALRKLKTNLGEAIEEIREVRSQNEDHMRIVKELLEAEERDKEQLEELIEEINHLPGGREYPDKRRYLVEKIYELNDDLEDGDLLSDVSLPDPEKLKDPDHSVNSEEVNQELRGLMEKLQGIVNKMEATEEVTEKDLREDMELDEEAQKTVELLKTKLREVNAWIEENPPGRLRHQAEMLQKEIQDIIVELDKEQRSDEQPAVESKESAQKRSKKWRETVQESLHNIRNNLNGLLRGVAQHKEQLDRLRRLSNAENRVEALIDNVKEVRKDGEKIPKVLPLSDR
jgi:hypothetical protein